LRRLAVWMVVFLVAACAAWAAEPAPPTDVDVLGKALATPVAIAQGRMPAFTVTFSGRYREGTVEQTGELVITRADAQSYGLSLKSQLFGFVLRRDAEATRLSVPSAQLVLVGKGPVPAHSDLEPGTLFPRLAAAWPLAQTAMGVLQAAEPGAVALLLQTLLDLQRAPDKEPPTYVARRSMGDGSLAIELAPDGLGVRQLTWRGGDAQASVGLAIRAEAALPPVPAEGMKVLAVPRDELERTLGRGLARAAEILAQESQKLKLRGEPRVAGDGRLAFAKDSRLATLQGGPYEIGFQHGRLLGAEARRLADSVLYVVGLYATVAKGEWFLDRLRGAWSRLQPHIPAEYVEEMKGLADGSGLSLEETELANVFPELFHCSGFALFGKATAGGKLYHGRVLDYMTEVGLQREAVVFVVKKKGAIPFANVGYAGFVGSVSGMNAERVAFGEMGGGGEGLWDGVPMAILMRMGLERAHTLADAIRIFSETKRTCEYYYVISDGKGPAAVGVGATPDRIEFVQPGQAHPKLPTVVEDAVLMSAGDRYKRLAEAVKAGYGKIDEKAAFELMKRPIAMKSNLHDVLFVPQDLVFWVANARGRKPACDQPYARYELKAILAEMGRK